MTRARVGRGWLLGAGGAAAVIIALTAYAAVSGDDSDATTGRASSSSSASASASPGRPVPTYTAPDDWTEPQQWISLQRGTTTDPSGNRVGFPHTTTGAASLLAAANTTNVEGGRTAAAQQLAVYRSYVSPDDQSSAAETRVREHGEQTDQRLRARIGYSSTMPSGTYMRTHIVGIKIVQESPNEVTAWLLGRATLKTSSATPEDGSYTRTLAVARWAGNDWKLSAQGTARALQQQLGTAPGIVAPGDAAFNQAGWAAIRQAS